MSFFDFNKKDKKSDKDPPKEEEKVAPKPQYIAPYKLCDLKFYNTFVWLANNEKKYGQVFEASETNYLYAELSLYNKLFDEEDWDLNCTFRIFDLLTGKEIANIPATAKVAKTENIFYLHQGWGVKEKGKFWTKGEYRWEAWVDNQCLASKLFYINNLGAVTNQSNPYFRLVSVRLFEGPTSFTQADQQKYYSQFSSQQTRFIWVEFIAENLNKQDARWPLELLFSFYHDTGQLKGKSPKLNYVYKTDGLIYVTMGWGLETAGSWSEDNYRLEVVFMDQLITAVAFCVGADFILNDPSHNLIIQPVIPQALESQQSAQTFPEVMAEIEKMIGLEPIKKQLKEYAQYLQFLQLRTASGFKESQQLNLHSVFTGNPGTGKTTVAKLLGKIYKNLNLLSSGHVHEVDRSDLIGQYIGHTAPRVKAAIQKARGGILFIDEAYSLVRTGEGNNDFGNEVIEILIKEMSDGEGDLVILAAGYPKEMDVFINSNPGLKSRFNVTYPFPDYTPSELLQIAEYACNKRSLTLTPYAKDFLQKKLIDTYRDRKQNFGNARFVHSLIDQAKMNMGLRIMQQSRPQELAKEELSTLTLEDIQKIFTADKRKLVKIPIDDELLKESLQELRALVGLVQIKAEVDELVKLARFYQETGKDLPGIFSLHSVFKGNPGTGKTTVARLIAKIYKAIGILERGHLVECDRQALVSNYIGDTAKKTNDLIDQALGGVLFIDEAYALATQSQNDFGQEAIETLLKRMEDKRGEFAVIVAGYTKNMDMFLESNPGLKSRFDQTFFFEDYKTEELCQIAMTLLKKENLVPDEACGNHLQAYFESLFQNRDEFFGNARDVRNTIEEAIKNQNLRLATLTSEQRIPEVMTVLTLADVAEFKIANGNTAKNRIGFAPE